MCDATLADAGRECPFASALMEPCPLPVCDCDELIDADVRRDHEEDER